MKKLSLLPLALIGVLSLASCSQDDAPAIDTRDGNVHLTVAMPKAIESRTFSDGLSATQLQYSVYLHGETTPLAVIKQADGTLGTKGTATFVDKETTIDLTLATSKNYDIVFWAQDPTVTAYTFDETKQTVTTNFTGAPVNDDAYDAFTANYTTGVVAGPISETITLYRPFAQINVGTNDIAEAKAAGLTVNTVDIAVPSYNTLNLMNNQVGVDGNFDTTVTPPTVIYKAAALPGTDEVFPVQDYTYLSMNYLLVPQDKSNVDVRFYVNEDNITSTIYPPAFATYNNVPVQRNHRTNIYGALLTNPAEFKVIIEESFDKPDFDYSIKGWNGTVADKLTTDADNKTVVINAPEEFALFAQQINSGKLDKNTPVKLTTDMDLNSIEWTPIKGYTGNFDGQNHTIKNLSITKTANYMGMFDHLTNNAATVKNLTIENVYIVNTTDDSDTGTGAVAGDPYTTSLQNITVQGDIYITAVRYVGAVGGHNVYGNCSDITVNANPGSYVRSTSSYVGFFSAPAQCGGVFGYIGEGDTKLTNIHSNIDVIADSFGVGGLFGTLQYGNQVTDCSSSGNVTLTKQFTTSEEEYAKAIGGIAGDYVPGSRIDVNGCTFTGTLNATVNGAAFTGFLNNSLVGTSYGGRSAGVGVAASNLYIDGVQKPIAGK